MCDVKFGSFLTDSYGGASQIIKPSDYICRSFEITILTRNFVCLFLLNDDGFAVVVECMRQCILI